jgi:hypothetical protein
MLENPIEYYMDKASLKELDTVKTIDQRILTKNIMSVSPQASL